jgi:hypothetical protein
MERGGGGEAEVDSDEEAQRQEAAFEEWKADMKGDKDRDKAPVRDPIGAQNTRSSAAAVKRYTNRSSSQDADDEEDDGATGGGSYDHVNARSRTNSSQGKTQPPQEPPSAGVYDKAGRYRSNTSSTTAGKETTVAFTLPTEDSEEEDTAEVEGRGWGRDRDRDRGRRGGDQPLSRGNVPVAAKSALKTTPSPVAAVADDEDLSSLSASAKQALQRERQRTAAAEARARELEAQLEQSLHEHSKANVRAVASGNMVSNAAAATDAQIRELKKEVARLREENEAHADSQESDEVLAAKAEYFEGEAARLEELVDMLTAEKAAALRATEKLEATLRERSAEADRLAQELLQSKVAVASLTSQLEEAADSVAAASEKVQVYATKMTALEVQLAEAQFTKAPAPAPARTSDRPVAAAYGNGAGAGQGQGQRSSAASSQSAVSANFAQSSGGSNPQSELSRRVHAFYARYNPSKTAEIPQLLEKFQGREDEMMDRLVKKYGPEPTAPGQRPSNNNPGPRR